jgi:hypothetical protein
MKCKFCSKETANEYQVCEECEKTLTVAINKNRKKMVKTKIANQNRGITSLVCAIIAMSQPFGLIVSYICGIVSIVFAATSKNTAGASFGKVGKTIGIVSLVSTILTLFIRLAMFALYAIVLALVIVCIVALNEFGIF